MSKRDYYEILSVERTATDVEIKAGLSQAGGTASSRQKSRRCGSGRKIQGSGRSLFGSLRFAETRVLRPFRAFRRGGGARVRSGILEYRGHFRPLRVRRYVRRQRGRPAHNRPARRRSSLRSRDHAGRGRDRQRRKTPHSRGSKTATNATAKAPKREPRPKPASPAAAAAKRATSRAFSA